MSASSQATFAKTDDVSTRKEVSFANVLLDLCSVKSQIQCGALTFAKSFATRAIDEESANRQEMAKLRKSIVAAQWVPLGESIASSVHAKGLVRIIYTRNDKR